MVAARRKRPKPGDVLELRTPAGVAYMQYVGRHPSYGDAILVSSRLHEHRAGAADIEFGGGYITFYPVALAVAEGVLEVVGHMPPPDLPRRLRRPGVQYGPRVETWVIEDDSAEVVRTRLSDEELRLPIAAIWNHEFLVQRVVEGWHPTQEGNAS